MAAAMRAIVWRRFSGVAQGSVVAVAGLTTSSTVRPPAPKRSRIVRATTALSRMKTSSEA
jgi:hypothetical protein